jgi:hypothetical protein
MIRCLILILLLLTLPVRAFAIEAPDGQVFLDDNTVLRGRFTEERHMKGLDALQSSGHFIVAPAHGLIWNTDKPLPTSTIVTPNGLAQDIGGIILKLPAKHLHHLYEMVDAALAGDWSRLEADFIITPSRNGEHWQMVLTARDNSKSKLPYDSITVSGTQFVESIAMIKDSESYDRLSFSDAILTRVPLTANESAVFKEVGR